jgi:hypothetical protein
LVIPRCSLLQLTTCIIAAKGVILADPELEKQKPPKGSKEDMEQFLDDLLD